MHKTLKRIWISSGILIFLWTAFWFFRLSEEPGIVGNVIKYTIGLYLLILYGIVAIVYFINKKMYKKKNKRQNIKWQSKK